MVSLWDRLYAVGYVGPDSLSLTSGKTCVSPLLTFTPATSGDVLPGGHVCVAYLVLPEYPILRHTTSEVTLCVFSVHHSYYS